MISKRKNPRGRPKVWGGPNKLDEILDLFPKDGSRIQHKELKRKALEKGISPNTLYLYLRKLEENLQVIKEVDISAKPPKVFYKRLTNKDFLRIEEIHLPEAELTWLRSKEIPTEVRERFERSYLEKALALLLAYLLRIGERASAIDDYQKRKEFIDIALDIHLRPLLFMLSDRRIEPRHWADAFEIVEKMQRGSDQAFRDEMKRILPEELWALLCEALDTKEMREFAKKSRKFTELVSSLKCKKEG